MIKDVEVKNLKMFKLYLKFSFFTYHSIKLYLFLIKILVMQQIKTLFKFLEFLFM